MKTISTFQILDSIAEDQISPNLDLAPAIIAKIQKKKGLQMKPKIKIATAILFVMIALLVVFHTVPAVKAAFERWFGYIPGIGLVSDGQVCVLDEPVKVTRDGVTVTVDQVVLDQEHTSLLYSVDGIPDDAVIIQPVDAFCDYKAILRLPDGSQLLATPNGVQNWVTGYQHRFDYAPLPLDANDAVLVIPCLFQTKPGAAPENWEIPLHFIPAPPEMTVYPVIEIPTLTATASLSMTSDAADNTSVDAANMETMIMVTLDRAVQMDDGYLLYATLHWSGTDFNTVDLIDPEKTVHLMDSSGKEMLFEIHYDEKTGVRFDQQQTVFAIKTAPLKEPGPLTLIIDMVLVDQPADISFSFDPGSDPKQGQLWESNLALSFGERQLQINSVTASSTGYSFEMTSDSGIRGAVIMDKDHPIVSGFSGENSAGNFFSGFDYADGLPQGPLNLTVSGIGVEYTNKLEVEWTPPAISSVQEPAQLSVCLTSEIWKTVKDQQSVVLPEVPEKVLIYGPVDQDNLNGAWEVAITNLDGSQRLQIPGGRGDGSVSPDGTKLTYATIDGDIRVADLSNGVLTIVPGTANGDSNPLWTPDGSRIVFNRGVGIFDLFIVNPDGSNLRQLTYGGGQESTIGWLSDNSLLYSVPDEGNGYIVYRLDVESGESQVFSNESIHSVSPDGQSFAVAELTFGDRWILTVTNLNGEERHSLNDNTLSILPQIWSPDSEWILTSVMDSDGSAPVSALINPRNCEVVLLLQLKDDALDWVK